MIIPGSSLVAAVSIGYGFVAGVYPDPKLTPGAFDLSLPKSRVCKVGYTKDVRNVTDATKKLVFERYKIPWSQRSNYEVDHFISLENFGLNTIENLWPEPYCPVGNDPLKTACWGAREKDRVETQLHYWACVGRITPREDVAILKSDWRACYIQILKGEVCRPKRKSS